MHGIYSAKTNHKSKGCINFHVALFSLDHKEVLILLLRHLGSAGIGVYLKATCQAQAGQLCSRCTWRDNGSHSLTWLTVGHLWKYASCLNHHVSYILAFVSASWLLPLSKYNSSVAREIFLMQTVTHNLKQFPKACKFISFNDKL